MIKQARLRKHLTQKQLARLVCISQSYISKLENNTNISYSNNLPINKLLRLAKVLDLNAVLLFMELTGSSLPA